MNRDLGQSKLLFTFFQMQRIIIYRTLMENGIILVLKQSRIYHFQVQNRRSYFSTLRRVTANKQFLKDRLN